MANTNEVVAENQRMTEKAKLLLDAMIREAIKSNATERISVEITIRNGALVALKRNIESVVK